MPIQYSDSSCRLFFVQSNSSNGVDKPIYIVTVLSVGCLLVGGPGTLRQTLRSLLVDSLEVDVHDGGQYEAHYTPRSVDGVTLKVPRLVSGRITIKPKDLVWFANQRRIDIHERADNTASIANRHDNCSRYTTL